MKKKNPELPLEYLEILLFRDISHIPKMALCHLVHFITLSDTYRNMRIQMVRLLCHITVSSSWTSH